jgi:hypothetical protein
MAINFADEAAAHNTGLTGNFDYCNSVCARMPSDSSRHWYSPNGALVCSYSIFNGCNSGNDEGLCPDGFATCFAACTQTAETGTTTLGCHGYFCGSTATTGQKGTCGGPSGQSPSDRSRCGGKGTLTYQGWGTTNDCANAACWCDASCMSYGDCCADAGHCTEVSTTCESTNSCGGYNSANSCYCDQACLKYGDCCLGGPCGA